MELIPSASASITSISAWRSTSSAVHGVRRSSVASHLNPKLPPVEQRTVHCIHGVLCVALVEETHKGETAALFGVSIPGNIDISHTTVLLKNSTKSLRRCSIRKVIHFQGGHSLHVWRRPPVAHVLRCPKPRMIKGKLLCPTVRQSGYRQLRDEQLLLKMRSADILLWKTPHKTFLPRHAAHMKWRQQRFPFASLCALSWPLLIGWVTIRFSWH